MFLLLPVAALLCALALLLLVASPGSGMLLVFLSRPIVDATWDQLLIWEFNLGRLMSVLVPLAVLFHAMTSARGSDALRRMPFKGLWLAYSAYCLFFSVIMLVQESPVTGAEVFFRHINGIVGFYVLQAWFADPKQLQQLLKVLVLAGLFPLTVGLYQVVAGVQFNEQLSEGLTRRIGLYHDAFTVRFYMLQTLLSVLLYLSMFRPALLWRLGLLAMAGACFVVLYFAFSKSAFAALVAWWLIWVVFRRDAAALTYGVLGGVVMVAATGGEVLETLATVFRKELGFVEGEVGADRIFAGRLYGWAQILQEWSQLSVGEQWFGAGRRATDAHNDYLQLLIHGGIVGVLLYVALLATVGVSLLWRAWRGSLLGVIGLMAFTLWLIDSIGLVPSSYPGYQWFVWGLIGLALAAERVPSLVVPAPRRKPQGANASSAASERHPLALPQR